jgi:hypothetical protein
MLYLRIFFVLFTPGFLGERFSLSNLEEAICRFVLPRTRKNKFPYDFFRPKYDISFQILKGFRKFLCRVTTHQSLGISLYANVAMFIKNDILRHPRDKYTLFSLQNELGWVWHLVKVAENPLHSNSIRD